MTGSIGLFIERSNMPDAMALSILFEAGILSVDVDGDWRSRSLSVKIRSKNMPELNMNNDAKEKAKRRVDAALAGLGA